eukprot:9250111-Alexandrium_andersonii.AAC.1
MHRERNTLADHLANCGAEGRSLAWDRGYYRTRFFKALMGFFDGSCHSTDCTGHGRGGSGW